MAELATIRHLLAEASPVTEDEITPEKHLVKDLELDSFSLRKGIQYLNTGPRPAPVRYGAGCGGLR